MAYAYARSDKLMGTTVPSMLVSARYQVDGADTEIENGNMIELKGLMEGERELYIANAPTASSKLEDCVLVLTPEICYDERKKNLNEFINEAGSNIRGYRLHRGDIFSVTAEAIDGTAAVGDDVTLMAGTKLQAKGSGTKVGTVIQLENEYIVIQVA